MLLNNECADAIVDCHYRLLCPILAHARVDRLHSSQHHSLKNNPGRAIKGRHGNFCHRKFLIVLLVSTVIPKVTTARGRPRMDERHVWWECDRLEWRAQHMLTKPTVAAVDILHGDVDALLRALEVCDRAKPQPKGPS